MIYPAEFDAENEKEYLNFQRWCQEDDTDMPSWPPEEETPKEEEKKSQGDEESDEDSDDESDDESDDSYKIRLPAGIPYRIEANSPFHYPIALGLPGTLPEVERNIDMRPLPVETGQVALQGLPHHITAAMVIQKPTDLVLNQLLFIGKIKIHTNLHLKKLSGAHATGSPATSQFCETQFTP